MARGCLGLSGTKLNYPFLKKIDNSSKLQKISNNEGGHLKIDLNSYRNLKCDVLNFPEKLKTFFVNTKIQSSSEYYENYN